MTKPSSTSAHRLNSSSLRAGTFCSPRVSSCMEWEDNPAGIVYTILVVISRNRVRRWS
jgi:hypothetical protein